MSVFTGTLQATLTSATPLLIAALGENLVQKAGIVNVGLEGMMLTGAFAATLGTLYPRNPLNHLPLNNPYIGVFCGAIGGLLLALLFALFVIRWSANQVVVGVVINLLALGLTGTIYRKLFGATGQFVSTAALPPLNAGLTPTLLHHLQAWNLDWIGSLTLLTPFALFAVPVLWLWLRRTRKGLELRACGEQPTAAASSGISVERSRFVALLVGGAMAGMAGAFLSIGDSNTFVPNMTAGRGFIALAIVTAGRWNPCGCLAAALLFGFAEALQYRGQAMGLHLPYQIFLAMPYIGTLLILAWGTKRSYAPAALGRPYRRA